VNIQTTLAVVIKLADHGESDKIVTFYCPVLGKLTGIAKGAKRSKKRFLNKLELFSQLEIDYAPNRRSRLVRIDQAELINPFPTLRASYSRFAAASLLSELMYFWTRENDGDQELFNLFLWALESLDQHERWLETVILFQAKFFTLLGYQPQLTCCMECGTTAANRAPYRFSHSQGGLVCKQCNRETGASSTTLSLGTTHLLSKAQDLPNHKLARLRFSQHSAKEALVFFRRYGSFLLQRDLQSWKYLTELHPHHHDTPC